MRSVRSRLILSSRRKLTLITVAIGILVAVFAGWNGRHRQEPTAGIVVVRAAASTPAEAVPLTPITPARVAPTSLPVEVAVTHIRHAYPLLSDVVIECKAGRCSLTGTIHPLVTQEDLDRRQEMLLGGLATALAEDGYRMAVPFQIDEVADNTFHIQANVTTNDRP
jgi:hypothetical protein